MKKLYFLAASLLISNIGFAQIKSASVYTIKSLSSDKLLDVANSSLEDGATVNTWTNTGSDAQRWIINSAGKNVYTLTNVGSGKLLHAKTEASSVDQLSDTKTEDVKWIIKKTGGAYILQPATDNKLSLELVGGNTADGSKVSIATTVSDPKQKWAFEQIQPQAEALNAKTVAKAFDDWYDGQKLEKQRGFWDQAEMLEIVLDAYDVTKDERYKTKFETLYNNFIARHKTDWQHNDFNDDIAWAVLFSVRGYNMTGDKRYLDQAKTQYDKMYARAFTNAYGGGLLWYVGKTSKNACIEGPASVAACYLAKATGDNTYYDKAVALYNWSKIYLFNAATGKVSDNVDLDKKTGKLKFSFWSSTYNQGTFLGAAVMLYNHTKEYTYLEEAERIAKYCRDEMYKGGVMNNEEGGNDLPGFKGIFARYARMYTAETKKDDLVEWLKLNAKVAYNNRNSKGVTLTNWGTRTPEVISQKSAPFSTSTMVSLMVNTLPFAGAK
ncbi:glycoside hydrolase family 76 protein [Mucilaginibacter myungsuensis]|uniref:RICIN domain-containing protein n=1 Tax=Mucilaginibacter myungsuensis TaxID=649104 RepID=A0A929KSZ9_9SPHI|nr:glycoside hydrolase family 76 protein [Mucilaginibacter myungsuensis]MBE9660257.1 RICIN domain-containing protein [Mucilaginibacter myungsuensis]MDN3600299.1 glycoside hydrolase family 76 protein [Mucilaginibacter myungsuensis]